MIKVEHLTKRYGGHCAVDDLSFTVEEGKIYGLLGPNGAGKSTTMNIITGYISASEGTVTVDGVNYHHIIDPDTGMPSVYWRSVSVVCRDSALADVLSTTLFVLPLQEGKALANQAGAEVIWLDHTGQQYYTDHFIAN